MSPQVCVVLLLVAFGCRLNVSLALPNSSLDRQRDGCSTDSLGRGPVYLVGVVPGPREPMHLSFDHLFREMVTFTLSTDWLMNISV